MGSREDQPLRRPQRGYPQTQTGEERTAEVCRERAGRDSRLPLSPERVLGGGWGSEATCQSWNRIESPL